MNLQTFTGGPPVGFDLNPRGSALFGGDEEPVVSIAQYTGTGSAREVRIGFQPDFVMVKASGRHWVQNDRNTLAPSSNAHARLMTPLSFQASANFITGFTSGGFTVGTGVDVNAAGETFTYYAFKFRRSFLNTTSFTGNGSNPRNISHNLGAVPQIMMLKNLSDTTLYVWNSFQDLATFGIGPGFRVPMTNAVGAADATWLNNTAPTASVFTVGSNITNQNTAFIACWQWASDDKNSKLGTYTGDGNTHGPTITLPFAPKMIILKRTFTVVSSWGVFDNVNNASSPWAKWWDWSGNGAQQTDANGIIVSGRTFRPPLTWNAAGGGFTYMAFS